ncbi:MAG: hypothetical protein GY737_32300 [Desulfobacteraceae bacterium]|nr:hypothetical protein [Desulfobacteraceae bacterium]
MIFPKKDNFSVPALAACMLGLVTSPFIYIAIGAPFHFPPAFSFLIIPPFLVGSGFLLWRFLSKPTDHAMKKIPMLLEGISWMAIAIFIILVSRFNLQTKFERLGLFCTFFLSASLCCLPLVLIRKTALEQRLARLPGRVAISALLIILGLSGLSMISYLLSSPAFI